MPVKPAFLTIFKDLHYSHALFVVGERNCGDIIQGFFAGMAEWRMAQVVAESDRVGKVFIDPQRSCDCSCKLRYFKCMRKTGPVMVSKRRQKHLCLMLQPPE